MSEPPVDTSAEAVEGMICSLYGHPAQAMLRAMKRERGELRQRVLMAEKAARVTLEEAQRAGPCFKSILLREGLTQAEAERDVLRRFYSAAMAEWAAPGAAHRTRDVLKAADAVHAHLHGAAAGPTVRQASDEGAPA